MVVVAIIALLASIAVPNFLRARKRSQATRILEDLRIIDGSIDQYAIENNKSTGATVNWTDIQNYLKKGSVLYNSTGMDLFGQCLRRLLGRFDSETPVDDLPEAVGRGAQRFLVAVLSLTGHPATRFASARRSAMSAAWSEAISVEMSPSRNRSKL